MADPIKVWQNDAQQLFEMNQDLASVNAAGVESDGQLAFFVGKPTTGNQWTLKKITPNELGKLVYDYLTSSSIASQLASVLGASANLLNSAFSAKQGLTSTSNIDDIESGLYGGIGWLLDGAAVAGLLIAYCLNANFRVQIAMLFGSGNANTIKSRTYNNGWTAWKNL